MIDVEQKNQDEFGVVAGEKGDQRQYMVTLDDDYYQLLTQGKVSKEELIRKSFQFLLEREPKESILSRFNLRVINNYFPEFEKEIYTGEAFTTGVGEEYNLNGYSLMEVVRWQESRRLPNNKVSNKQAI
jgi:hypothetical protein